MYFGFNSMLKEIGNIFYTGKIRDLKMIEIGAYMGESTMMIACTGLFKTTYVIEPHKGEEEFNKEMEYDWDVVKDEYIKNTRYFDNITLISDYSYNVVDRFEDKSIDFIYIDANHSYEDVKRDLELYYPKLKSDGVIGGHDFNDRWPGVKKAVTEVIGIPVQLFEDDSWIYYSKKLI
jgi:hypothetical protein